MRGLFGHGGGLGAISLALAAASSATPVRKIYGADNIKRHLQKHGRSRRGSGGSLAPYRHNDTREIERRGRQEARNAERQAVRFYGVGPRDLGVVNDDGSTQMVAGMSRRGRLLLVTPSDGR